MSKVLVTLFLLGPGALGRSLLLKIRNSTKGVSLSSTAEQITRSYVSNKFQLQFEYFSSYWPGGWKCQLQLRGREILMNAMQKERGVILWVTPSSSSDLVVKRCFSEHQIDVAHLSALTHGYSSSRFGVKFINSVNRTIENRYIAHRIILTRGATGDAIREINNRISNKEVVSITAVKNKGGRSTSTRFFSARLPLGVGAINIAYNTGCVLLPVFCVRESNSAKDPTYSVEIGQPLEVNPEVSKSEAFAEVLRDYGDALEKHVRIAPEQWSGWTHLTVSDGKPDWRQAFWNWLHKSGPDDDARSLNQP
ncbi:MAG: hypothetical protein KJO31_05560 [Gammaproteobacteria bacterium]|nr:hypothetical protein [Gammaproteobacteria bacterium]